jgi:hypothetical protein
MTTLAGTVESGRILAESLMVDEARITRLGEMVLDKSTGRLTPSSTLVYEGKCRVRVPGLVAERAIFGETVATRSRYVVSLPRDAPRVRIGDVIDITETNDAVLAELKLRVSSINASTYVMKRSVGAEVVE